MQIIKHVSLTRIPGNRTSLKWSSFAHVLSELEQWAKFSSSSKHGSQNLLPFFVWWVLSKISNFKRNKRKKTIKIRIFINICGCKPSIINRFANFFPLNRHLLLASQSTGAISKCRLSFCCFTCGRYKNKQNGQVPYLNGFNLTWNVFNNTRPFFYVPKCWKFSFVTEI